MRITQSQLIRAIPNIDRARLDEFVASFNQWAFTFGITTPQRVTHYIAQIMEESGCLKYTEENLNYSAQGLLKTFPRYFDAKTAQEYAGRPQAIANRVYANRIGNGSEESGDGWRYRGRGFIQLTGKENYERFNAYDLCTEDVVEIPDKVAKFPLNQISSMWFWQSHMLSEIADSDDGGKIGESIVERITRKINSGLTNIASRKYYYRRLKKEFGL